MYIFVPTIPSDLTSSFQMMPHGSASSNGQSIEDIDMDQENVEHRMKKSKRVTKEQLEDLFNEVERHPLHINEKWYLISISWWKKLISIVKDGFIDDVKPIDNSKISSVDKNGKYFLLPKMIEKIDFILVPEHVFKMLVDSFGVEISSRDVIERIVCTCALRKTPYIEIYPRMVTVCLAKDRKEKVSLTLKNDTVGQLRRRALDALGVTEPLNKIRFYIDHEDKPELLPIVNEDEPVAAVFSAEPTIIVDILDDNGKGFIMNKNSYNNDSYGDEYSSSPVLYTRGVCGLQNLGNTCFMASAVQCLSNVPVITEYFLSDLYLNDLNETNPLGTQGQLAKVYGQLMHHMWSGRNSYFCPRNFKSVIGRFAPRFSGYAQQDSQELLAFLLDGLHEDLNRVKVKPYTNEDEENEGKAEKEVAERAWEIYKMRNDSIIVDKVHGQLRSTLVCPTCSKVSIKFDPFCFLSVPIPVKDRLFLQSIVLIHNPSKKWAKFSVSVTRKTTVAEVIQLIREDFNDIELVFFTSSEYCGINVLDPLSPIAPDGRSRNDLYAAQLTNPLEGNEILIVRPYISNRPRTLPMIFTVPKNYTEEQVREYINKEAIPFFKETYEDGIIETNDENEENEKEEISIELDKNEKGWNGKINYIKCNMKDRRGLNLIDREKSVSDPKQVVTLIDCINLFTREEQLSEQDSWYCPKCKEHVRANKKLDIWKLPEILIVHLKRFQYSRWSREKIDTAISIPGTEFHLRDILANDSHDDVVYDLIAVSHHSGGLGGGHYTADALNGDKWYHFNDASVHPTSAPFGQSNGSSPYLLFYRRRQPPSPIHSDEHLDMETDD